jgi:adenine-specific DNA-methyltransferase
MVITIKNIQDIDLQDIWQGKTSGVEENVKLKIVLPLLNILGYDPIKDMDFEHFVENKRADIAIIIKEKPKIVIECKSLEKNLDDHIAQVLNYAIKMAIPYILLTNGKEFRLYKPFIENLINPKDRLLVSVHLKTLEQDFPELYEWVSKDSLLNNKIEDKSEETIKKLRDEITPKTLIENLINAKKILIADAMKKILPKFGSDIQFRNLVDKWAKDSELDIKDTEKWCKILANEIAYSFINRLYFYRIAEDRGIVNPKLNKQALEQITKYIKYNQLIKLSFEEILKIDYEAIFKHDIFDMIEFDDVNIKKIIDSLSEYNFSKIDSDIIGKIYEYHVTKEERKSLGQFYTPELIIDYILKNIPIKETDKLLDPACGSGGFLIRAYDVFREQLMKDKANKNIHKQIIENNLFGYDINPFSVHLTAMNLALKNIESKTDVINVLERDSLSDNIEYDFGQMMKTLNKKEINRTENTDKFNVIVGNPPYFNISKDIIEKQHYDMQEFKEISSGVTNISSLFLKRYISMLEPNGYLGFVVPKSLTYSGSWEGIRKYILEQTEIIKIFDIHEAFEGVLLEQIVLIVQKKPCNKNEFIEIQYVDLPYKKKKIYNHVVKTNLFNNTIFPLYAFKLNQIIKEKILKDSKFIEQIADSPRGLQIQKYGYLFSKTQNFENEKLVLYGRDIKKYGIKQKTYIPYTREEFKQFERTIKILDCEKILIQGIISQTGNHLVLIATYDAQKSITVDTITNIIVKDDKFKPKYVLGFLNSKLAGYYAFNFIFNRAVRTIRSESLRKLPIKIISETKQQEIVDLVDVALNENLNVEKTKEIREKIDKKIYEIYSLTPQEIELIEESYK